MSILGTIGEFEHASVVLGNWQYSDYLSAFSAGGLRSGLVPRTAGTDTNRIFRTFPTSVTTACITSKNLLCAWGLATQQIFLGLSSHELSATPGGVPVLGLRTNYTSKKLELVVWNPGSSTWSVLDTSPIAMSNGSMRFDMFVENYGAGARVRVWGRYFQNTNSRIYSGPQVLYLDFTGDVRASGYTFVDTVFATQQNTLETTYPIGSIIAATEETNRYELFEKHITGVGDVNTMASGIWSDIDELDVNTADTVNSDIDDQEILCAGNTLPVTNMEVLAVDLGALSIRGVTGPQKLRFGVKTNAAEYWPAGQTQTTSWAPYQELMTLNPVTGLPWEVAEVNALQIGAKSTT